MTWHHYGPLRWQRDNRRRRSEGERMTEQYDRHVLIYRMHCEFDAMRKYLIWRSSQSWAQ
jgi:hypothetical protein